MMRRISLVLAAAGGAAALAATGVALGVTAADRPAPGSALTAVTAGPAFDDNPKPDDRPGTRSAAPDPTAGAGRGAVTPQRAGDIALARVGAGRIVEVEAEDEHDRPVWSVKVVTGDIRYEVKVDRSTGAVLETEHRAADDRYDDHGGDRTRSDDHHDDDGSDDHGGDRERGDD